MTRKTAEVARKARELIEGLRRDGHSERDIVLGLTIAVQAAPVTRALAENPRVQKLFKHLGPMIKEGLEAIEAIKELRR